MGLLCISFTFSDSAFLNMQLVNEAQSTTDWGDRLGPMVSAGLAKGDLAASSFILPLARLQLDQVLGEYLQDMLR